MKEATTKTAAPTSSSSSNNKIFHDYFKIFLNYLLVFIVIAYLHSIKLPQLIETLLEGKGTGIAPTTRTTAYSATTPAAEFNDVTFMKNYKCNNSVGYRLKFLKRDPLVMHLEGFLQPGEAEHLISIGKPLMQKSTVAAKEQYHPGRTSFNAFLTRQHDPVVECIEQRALLLTQKPLNTIEPLQVVWYRHGQKYEPHHDAFLRSNPESESELSQCGQRETTLFVYLNTVPESQGGHTSFPELSLKVPATKNDAAYWYNVQVNGEDDLRVLHGGDPVYGSDDVEKWGLNIWIREKKCYE